MNQHPTRRQVLAALSGIAACRPGPTAPRPLLAPALPPWTPPGAVAEATFPFGLRAGDPTADGLVLSGRTTLPEVTLLGARWFGDRWVALPPRTGLAPQDGFVRVEVDGLGSDLEYTFALATPDGAQRSEAGCWRTLPTSPRVVTFGATCCFGGFDPGLPSLADAAAHRLDLMLLLGDAIYTRTDTLDGYREQYEVLHAVPALRALAAATPLVAVWDDHEVANNWALEPDGGDTPVTAEQVEAARTAFREALPQREGAAGVMWRSLTVGDTLELLLLDCRSERAPDRIVSDAQLAWAVDRVKRSRCAFKVVASSVHLTDHATWMAIPGSEEEDARSRWQGFPAQREALLAACDAVPGVVVVTGDGHYGGIQRVSPAGTPGADLIEVAAGPAGSEPWDVEAWLEGAGADLDRYLDLAPVGNWARFVADPVAGVLSVELVDGEGGILAARELVRLA